MEQHFSCIGVTNEKELHEVGNLLHDEYFRLSEVCWQKPEGIVQIHFQRIWHNGPRRVVNRFLYRIEEVDVLRGMLRFNRKSSAMNTGIRRIWAHSFNRFVYDVNRGLINVHCSDVQLMLQVHRLDANIRTGISRYSRINVGWFLGLQFRHTNSVIRKAIYHVHIF